MVPLGSKLECLWSAKGTGEVSFLVGVVRRAWTRDKLCRPGQTKPRSDQTRHYFCGERTLSYKYQRNALTTTLMKCLTSPRGQPARGAPGPGEKKRHETNTAACGCTRSVRKVSCDHTMHVYMWCVVACSLWHSPLVLLFSPARAD
jgi:hypothetical protein